jgi:hypothetical protein
MKERGKYENLCKGGSLRCLNSIEWVYVKECDSFLSAKGKNKRNNLGFI